MSDVEPADSLWRLSCHEAGHAVLAYLHGAEVEGVTIYGGRHQCHMILPYDPDPSRKALKRALIDLGGFEAERVVCGRVVVDEHKYSDVANFAMDLRRGDALVCDWDPDGARVVLGAVVRGILRANERMLYDLANNIAARKHVYGEDAMWQLGMSARQWGVRSSPLMAADWASVLLKVLGPAAKALGPTAQRALERRAHEARAFSR